jgi:hypothetical protein
LSDERIAKIILVSGLEDKKIYLLNPYKYYDSKSTAGLKTINVVPFKDSTVISHFNNVIKKNDNGYISLVKFYIIDFLDLLCTELSKSRKSGFTMAKLER